jgi:hypothetical protein
LRSSASALNLTSSCAKERDQISRIKSTAVSYIISLIR